MDLVSFTNTSQVLPVVPLTEVGTYLPRPDHAFYPGREYSLALPDAWGIHLASDVWAGNKLFVTAERRRIVGMRTKPPQLNTIGTLCQMKQQAIRRSSAKITCLALERVTIETQMRMYNFPSQHVADFYLTAQVHLNPDINDVTDMSDTLVQRVIASFENLARLKPGMLQGYRGELRKLESPRQTAYTIAYLMESVLGRVNLRWGQRLLERDSVRAKLQSLYDVLTLEIKVLEQIVKAKPEPIHKDTLHCSRCNTPYEEGDAFCKKCGLSLTASETKTALATSTMTCPNCSAAVPNDAIFCAKCGFGVSLTGTTDATALVHSPLPPKRLKDSVISNTQAEMEAATTVKRTCPFCHTTMQLGPEDKFCGNCGYMLA